MRNNMLSEVVINTNELNKVELSLHRYLLEAYADCLSHPQDKIYQTGLFIRVVDIIQTEYGIGDDVVRPEYKRYAISKLVDRCSILRERDIDIHPDSEDILRELILEQGWWRAMQDLPETDDLLAALFISSSTQTASELLWVGTRTVAKEWRSLQLDKTDADFMTNVASQLFGDAWALLYTDARADNFNSIYRKLLSSRAPYITDKSATSYESSVPAPLPHDFTM